MSKHVVILGAGISGLSVAWFLKKQYKDSLQITVLESSSRTGGWIKSIEKEGFLLELGPHSCRARGPGIETLQLIENLGLQDQIVTASPAAKQRYLYTEQKLQIVPSSLFDFFSSPLTKGLFKALWKDWRLPKGNGEDESIHSFVSRRLNVSFAEKIFDPLVGGIHAGDIHQLSVQSCFPMLSEWEQQYGGILKGMLRKKSIVPSSLSPFVKKFKRKAIFSFKNGMETLPKELALRLKDHLHLNASVIKLIPHSKGTTVVLENGWKLEADHVISTLPGHQLGRLICQMAPQAFQMLQKIPHASLSMVSLGYRSQVLTKQGFGYLIPSQENEKILGMVWDSSVFPEQNRHENETRMTVMMGGMRSKEKEPKTDQQTLDLALDTISKHLNINKLPDVSHVHVVRGAIPQYLVGHANLIQGIKQEIKQQYPALSLSGTTFSGIAISDCISNAKKLAAEIGQ